MGFAEDNENAAAVATVGGGWVIAATSLSQVDRAERDSEPQPPGRGRRSESVRAWTLRLAGPDRESLRA